MAMDGGMTRVARFGVAGSLVAGGLGFGAGLLAYGCSAPLPDLVADPMGLMSCAQTSAPWLYAAAGFALAGIVAGRTVVEREPKEPRYAKQVWSGISEACKAGLIPGPKDDITRARIFGKLPRAVPFLRPRPLAYCGDAPAMVAGANRSGKGAGVLVPTLLCYGQSAVVIDPKGELVWGDPAFGFPGTSGWRSTFSSIRYWCPTDRRSHRFNFVERCRDGDYEVRDLQNLMIRLVQISTRSTFWDKASVELMVAIALHLRRVPGADASLAGIHRFLSRGDEGVMEIMAENLHPVAMEAAASLFPAGPGGDEGDEMVRARSDVYRTARSYLWLFDDPVVAEMTSGQSQIDLGDLMCAPDPMTLYIRVPTSDDDRVSTLAHLLLSQLWRELAEYLDADSSGRPKLRRCLVLLDEFAGLGHMPDFERALPKLPGYGFDVLLAVQTLAQIDQLYGPDNAIVPNCHVLAVGAANDDRTLTRVETMIGTAPEIVPSETATRRRSDLFGWGASRTTGEHRNVRKILNAGELRTLPENQHIVLRIGYRPWKARKVRYYEERELKARLLPPEIPPPPTASGRAGIPGA